MSDTHPIEAESYRILHQRVDLSTWPPAARQVVARMIHATADDGYATSARIGARAVDAALDALVRGAPIVVDTTMVAAGTPRLATTCLLDEVPVAPPGSTRAAAAFALAAHHHPEGAVWVVGNAPSALLELLARHRRGDVDPAAVIGLPVGFVGAAESKAELWEGPLGPVAITNVGERGGSPVAAAALNALHRLHRGDPC
ncbi:MAG: precorrin-8X methylmutase [Acidimicrobiales bacterium]